MSTVLVLGGYGVIGGHVTERLRRGGDRVIVAGRDGARAGRTVDLAERGLWSYRAALSGVDTVVNTSGAEDPRLAEIAGRHGAAFLDLTSNPSYIAALERADTARPVLVSVGLAPGLTNLLAAAVHEAEPGPVDLGILLGAGEQYGYAAKDWLYGLFGTDFHAGGERIRNFTRPEVFHVPGHGRRRLYRLDLSDQHVLSGDLGTPVRTYLGMSSRLVTALFATLTRLPGGSRLPRRIGLRGSEHWAVLARGRRGAARLAYGENHSHGTAVVTAAAVRAASQLPPGTHHLHRVLRLDDLPTGQGITLTAPTTGGDRGTALSVGPASGPEAAGHPAPRHLGG
ncbi:hypothetical protein [Streptomyces sp. NPDC088789]|uniref:hypothetical protein n=1 Tax=Streptomyces sp. NPDC088789 TaxID=3365899 RepID=UPI0038206202